MKWSVSHGSFLASSFLAIVIASILISIGWSSGSGNEYTYTVPIPEIKPQPELPISNSPTNISRKTIGLTGAPVTFVVYSDFQCSHCQSFALTIEKQLETTYVNTGKVLLEYRYIVAYGEESELAA
jgi:protein-disulfide isomerase